MNTRSTRDRRIGEILEILGLDPKREEVKSFLEKAKNRKFIILADHDGSICDTNQVKDRLLGSFVRELPEAKELKEPVSDDSVNFFHRDGHGKPMAVIFQNIFRELLGREITFDYGQAITEDLNKYIMEDYCNRTMYEGAAEYHELMHILGVPQYVLTGIEGYMAEASLKKHGILSYFDGIYGAPKNKEENIQILIQKHPGAVILGTGDSAYEANACRAVPGGLFAGIDMENRPERVLPADIDVATNYRELASIVVKLVAAWV